MSSQTINRWHEIYSKMLKDSLHIGQNTTAPCPSKGASKNVTSNHIDNQCFVGEWQSQFALLLPRYSNLYVHFLQRPFALHMLSNRWFCVSLFPFFFLALFNVSKWQEKKLALDLCCTIAIGTNYSLPPQRLCWKHHHLLECVWFISPIFYMQTTYPHPFLCSRSHCKHPACTNTDTQRLACEIT